MAVAIFLSHQTTAALVSRPTVVRSTKATHARLLKTTSRRLPAALKVVPAATIPGIMSYSAGSVQEAWDHHFSAFGDQDVEKILLGFSEKAIVTLYDHTLKEKTVYKEIEGVRKSFEVLFKKLSDRSDLAIPVIDVDGDGKMVFIVWTCPASGVMDATVTFLFDDESKIHRQNVVYRTG